MKWMKTNVKKVKRRSPLRIYLSQGINSACNYARLFSFRGQRNVFDAMTRKEWRGSAPSQISSPDYEVSSLIFVPLKAGYINGNDEFGNEDIAL